MKAISLWQPWASAIALGLKEYETRSWACAYRGPLAIHAAKRWTREEQHAISRFNSLFPGMGMRWPSPLPLGAVVCIAELTAIYRTEELYPKVSDMERAFGNYERGRFAWRLAVVEVFDVPVQVPGKQGLWEWAR